MKVCYQVQGRIDQQHRVSLESLSSHIDLDERTDSIVPLYAPAYPKHMNPRSPWSRG